MNNRRTERGPRLNRLRPIVVQILALETLEARRWKEGRNAEAGALHAAAAPLMNLADAGRSRRASRARLRRLIQIGAKACAYG